MSERMTEVPLPLVVENVSLKLDGQTILHEISLELRQGEILSLIGPNGAGKSTLLSVIAGDRQPDAGRVLLNGTPLRDQRALEQARQRAVLEQRPAVGFAFLVEEVVAMGRSPWRGTAEAARDEEVIQAALESTAMQSYAKRDALTLSGGESGRMSLARVLAQETPTLLLDEPAAALDLRHQEQIMRKARELADAGGSVLVVSHDLDAAAHFSDRLALLAGARIVACGAPTEVLDAATLSDVYGTPIEVFPHPTSGLPVVRPVRSARGRVVDNPSAQGLRAGSFAVEADER